MRAKDAGHFAVLGFLFGKIQTAGAIEAGEAFEEDAINRVVVTFDAAVDDGVERCLGGQWEQA
jgi:hypothetical protein